MDEKQNPYAAPTARLDDQSEAGEVELAGRWRRLGGAIIDSMVMLVLVVPLFVYMGVFNPGAAQEQNILMQLLLVAIGFAAWLLVNGYLLYRYGQSVGKRLLSMKIVRLDDQQAEFSRIVLLRALPMHLLSVVPVVGNVIGLVDVLFIFGSAKRCLHDYIAKTRVIMA